MRHVVYVFLTAPCASAREQSTLRPTGAGFLARADQSQRPQQLRHELIEHRQYIDKSSEDMPEIRNWKWSDRK